MEKQAVNQRGFRAPDAGGYLGVSRSTFLLLVKHGKVPQGKRVSAGCVIWLKDTLDEYLNALSAQKGEK